MGGTHEACVVMTGTKKATRRLIRFNGHMMATSFRVNIRQQKKTEKQSKKKFIDHHQMQTGYHYRYFSNYPRLHHAPLRPAPARVGAFPLPRKI